ncbi:MAG TPA: GlsB/YeaQ/YmgE family stress response membrane protein [Saprospiraceae bacterium]|nr:GlsB/YeaQ/YmgE family stress response membrane protein [Saprospiraceae bacterium]
MEMNDLISTLLVGAASGWLAGQIRQGYGFGILGNIVVGILGAFVGNWLFRAVLHVSLGSGLISTIATSVIGALVLLFLIGLLRKK